MAPFFPLSFPDMANALVESKTQMLTDGLRPQWEVLMKNMMLLFQVLSLNEGDLSDVFGVGPWLKDNRGFMTNSSGGDFELEYNGETFTFLAGVTYCGSKEEAAFFIAEAINQGESLVPSTIDDYFVSGDLQFYFE